MKEVHAKLPNDLLAAIEAAAEENRTSKSDIIRDVLSRYLLDGDMPEKDNNSDYDAAIENLDQKISNINKDINVLRAELNQQSKTITAIATNLKKYSKIMVQVTSKCFLATGLINDAKLAKAINQAAAEVTAEANNIYPQPPPQNNQQISNRPLGGATKEV